jgi:hypothetical protein
VVDRLPDLAGRGALVVEQPYRAPTTGVDSGGTLTHAAFGYDAIPNDGTALGS